MSFGAQQTGSRSAWGTRLGLFFIGTVLCVAILVYSTFYFGFVQGQEFSPKNFRRRHFAYYEIPLVGIQVSPITHGDRTSELERYLISEQIVSVKKGPLRWDLVQASRGGVPAIPGDAKILCDYLDATNADDVFVWLEWTKKNLPVAKILWPSIAELAHQELYIFIPDVLERARQAVSAPEFQRVLDRELTQKYVKLGQNQQALGRYEQAVELFSHALRHSPQDTQALRGQATSQEMLQTDQRNSDSDDS